MRKLQKLIDITALKFIFVGIINTLVGTAVMFVLYNVFHAGYWFSSAANYIVGSIVSFILNKHFTFRNNEKSVFMIVKFAVNISICYLIAYGIAKPVVLWILNGTTYSVQIQENIAMLAGMCLFVGVNYIGQRFFVFRNGKNEK